MHFVVCGLHLSEGPLNHQLITLKGKLIKATKTVPNYTMFALSSTDSPSKPGMIYHPNGGAHCNALTVEVWHIPDENIGALLQYVPAPLGFGTVFLEGGEKLYGFICEGWAADNHAAAKMGITTQDITKFGGWREWREWQASLKMQQS